MGRMEFHGDMAVRSNGASKLCPALKKSLQASFMGFSDDWQRSSMWRFFDSFGNVVDVFVPLKQARNGKRFGFVRFKGVRDETLLVQLVMNTWVGVERLYMNKAMFTRNRTLTNPSAKISKANNSLAAPV